MNNGVDGVNEAHAQAAYHDELKKVARHTFETVYKRKYSLPEGSEVQVHANKEKFHGLQQVLLDHAEDVIKQVDLGKKPTVFDRPLAIVEALKKQGLIPAGINLIIKTPFEIHQLNKLKPLPMEDRLKIVAEMTPDDPNKTGAEDGDVGGFVFRDKWLKTVEVGIALPVFDSDNVEQNLEKYIFFLHSLGHELGHVLDEVELGISADKTSYPTQEAFSGSKIESEWRQQHFSATMFARSGYDDKAIQYKEIVNQFEKTYKIRTPEVVQEKPRNRFVSLFLGRR